MTLPTRLLLFASLFALAAPAQSCKTSRKAAATTPQKTSTAATPQVTAVTMSRGYCFGKCPVYSIEIKNSGLVRYSGRQFVEKEGVYEKTFDKALVNNLLQDFTKARLDTMQSTYERVISDLPSIDYAVTFSDGKTQNIQNAHFGPQVLSSLARQVDEFTKSPDYSWKRTAEKVAE